eukprot:GDKI01029335.1.p2 GENE.GDKI01029335.1~~GDKI01029335.1.p2  ORF type:complete len:106 (+),score=34.62 GDKI01029335.1:3-320(+)
MHCRVGSTQAPQVPSIQTMEGREMTEAFMKWWRAVWDMQRAKGRHITTATPEFGPRPYTPACPKADDPTGREVGVGSCWDICDAMMQVLKEEFTHTRACGCVIHS